MMGTIDAQIRIPAGTGKFVNATALANSLKNMPSPIVLIVAGYIGLRALEIALTPPDSFRTRMAQALMTISAVGLLLWSRCSCWARLLVRQG